jgi:hypothetical protein
MKFQRMMTLDGAAMLALKAGTLKALPGQWFRKPDGSKAQYVGTRTDGAVAFSEAGKGDGFKGRTQRFARARWHQAKRHGDVVTMVRTAPTSVDDASLGRLARGLVAGGATA